MSNQITSDDVTVSQGEIIVDDKVIGHVFKFFKHGYHPMVELDVGGKAFEFEIDTKDLVNKVKEKVAATVTRE